jgi:hypothetical protein
VGFANEGEAGGSAGAESVKRLQKKKKFVI